MKTIKPPSTAASQLPKRIICTKKTCKAELEYEGSDVQYSDFGCPRDPGDVDMRFLVVCPHCKTNLFIQEGNLPDSLVIALREHYRS